MIVRADGPRQLAGAPEAAAIHQAADAKHRAEGDAGRGIGEFQSGIFSSAQR